ncbi:adenosyl-hopene transferase HpnH [Desulfovibrio inopinatus]|uniref:adenosyl-hopene transferase HpnH n=1 Tax=Desulfovibrio inopinatus TaxID=102109 RepID=UPI000426EB2A|nr:adenosyl-hopene transferase HpnH [Desulfovibrio inopinatus]
MSIPAIQQARIGGYILKNIATRTKRFPLVLMLEPLFACNLQCKGCGKIAHSPEVMKKRLSLEECLGSAEECGAPVVSIPGGEPLLHPEMDKIVAGLVKQKRFVYLCTNALLLEKRLHEFEPSPYLTFNVHLDGLRDRHDSLVRREGVFDTAVSAIKRLVARGYRVTTNTTVFAGDSAERLATFFDTVSALGVEGMTVSPGYNYASADDQDAFLERQSTTELFRRILEMSHGRGWRFNHSSLYLDFLAGNQNYRCTPWGNPTRNIFGWQRPCYLLDDGYAESFHTLMEETDWDAYGRGHDRRCEQCMVHCGFEPTAVLDTVGHPLKAAQIALRRRLR